MKPILFYVCLFALLSSPSVAQNTTRSKSDSRHSPSTSKALTKKKINPKTLATAKPTKNFWDAWWFKVVLVAFGFGIRTLWQLFFVERRDGNRKRRYLINVMESYPSKIDDQIKKIRTMCDDLNKGGIPICKITKGLKKDNIDAITRADAFNALVLKKKGFQQNSNAFISLYDSLDLVDKIQADLPEKYQNFVAAHNEYIREWNRKKDPIDILTNKIKAKKNDHSLNKFEEQVDKTFFVLSKIGENNIHNQFKLFITPLIQICQNSAPEGLSQQQEMLNSLLWLQTVYYDYKANVENFKNDLRHLDNHLLKAKENIQASLETLKT